MIRQWMRKVLDRFGYKGYKVPEHELVGYFLYKLWFSLRPYQIRALFKSTKLNLTHYEKVYVAVKDLELTHPVRLWDPFDFRIRKRLKILKSIPITTNEISQAFLNEHTPSVDNIKVIYFAGRYKVSDGNSRVKCLKIAHPDKYVEVDLFRFGD